MSTQGPAAADTTDESEVYLPSPAEIATECARIRATWGHAETLRRQGQDVRSMLWRPPTVRANGLDKAG